MYRSMKTNSAPIIQDALAFRIRPATEEDLDEIMQLEGSCFDEDAREDRSVYRERLRQFPEGCRLITIDDQTVGFFISELWNAATLDEELFEVWPEEICSHHDDGHRLYISSVALAPEFQGRGITSKFLATCLQRLLLQFAQVNEVILTVAEDWIPARRLYARAGFREQLVLRGFFGGRRLDSRDGFLMSATSRELLGRMDG